jgi:hypothetical protein
MSITKHRYFVSDNITSHRKFVSGNITSDRNFVSEVSFSGAEYNYIKGNIALSVVINQKVKLQSNLNGYITVNSVSNPTMELKNNLKGIVNSDCEAENIIVLKHRLNSQISINSEFLNVVKTHLKPDFGININENIANTIMLGEILTGNVNVNKVLIPYFVVYLGLSGEIDILKVLTPLIKVILGYFGFVNTNGVFQNVIRAHTISVVNLIISEKLNPGLFLKTGLNGQMTVNSDFVKAISTYLRANFGINLSEKTINNIVLDLNSEGTVVFGYTDSKRVSLKSQNAGTLEIHNNIIPLLKFSNSLYGNINTDFLVNYIWKSLVIAISQALSEILDIKQSAAKIVINQQLKKIVTIMQKIK